MPRDRKQLVLLEMTLQRFATQFFQRGGFLLWRIDLRCDGQCNDISVEQQGGRPQCADRAHTRSKAFGAIPVIPAEQRDVGSFFGWKNPDTVVFLVVNPPRQEMAPPTSVANIGRATEMPAVAASLRI